MRHAHVHEYRRRTPTSTVEICVVCRDWRHTEHAGPAIVEIPVREAACVHCGKAITLAPRAAGESPLWGARGWLDAVTGLDYNCPSADAHHPA